MNLIVISYDQSLKNEIPILVQLFEQGLETFHIRKPDFDIHQMEEYIRSIPEIYWDRLVLHSHYDLVYKFALGGVHATSDTFNLDHSFISSSCHSIKETQLFKNKLVKYVLLSPIFDSISKKNYNANFQKEALTQLLSTRRTVAIIALGGVNVNNIQTCVELGFDGVAVLGAIWLDKFPVLTFKKIKDKCQKFVQQY